MSEEIDEGLPEPRGKPLSTTVYFDSDHVHNQVKRRSVSGVISFVGSNPISWMSKRQGTFESSSYSSEEIDEGLSDPRWKPLSTTVYFDSGHAHDQVTRRSVLGVIYLVGSTPISWTSKVQGTIESSSYSAEFCAG